MRPDLNSQITAEEFRDFYWLKEELVEFCKAEGLDRRGGKIELADRIAHFLETGGKVNSRTPAKPKSDFDWGNAELTPKTVITDNYRNTENVRAFFKTTVGSKFRFTVKFMNWMKENVGATLEEAAVAWEHIQQQKKTEPQGKIAPQFEFNQYLRDFAHDNPGASRELVIECWKKKRAARGGNVYERSDLKLT